MIVLTDDSGNVAPVISPVPTRDTPDIEWDRTECSDLGPAARLLEVGPAARLLEGASVEVTEGHVPA